MRSIATRRPLASLSRQRPQALHSSWPLAVVATTAVENNFSSRAASSTSSAETTSPAASISVHKGYKVQAGLCIERPPLEVLDPEYSKRWRAFKREWELKTSNNLTIGDDLVFMRYHFHFLEGRGVPTMIGPGQVPQLGVMGGARPDSGAGKNDAGGGAAVAVAGSSSSRSKKSGGGKGGKSGSPTDAWGGARGDALSGGDAAAASADASVLSSILGDEGLDMAFPERGRRAIRKRKVEKKVAIKIDDADMKDRRRLSSRSLFLLVQYSGATRWTFPKADRPHGQEMRETLLRLCGRQLGTKLETYIVGACPFSHAKLKSDRTPGIDGRKVFYYRARLVPGGDVELPSDSPVSDWAWCSRQELATYLGDSEWSVVRGGLPLDDVELFGGS